MSSPFITQTARSIYYDPSLSHLGVNTVQEAIDKLAWLLSLNPLIDEDGNVTIQIGTPISTLTLTTYTDVDIRYIMSVTDEGELVATMEDIYSMTNAPSDNYKVFRKPNGQLVRPSCTEEGEIIIEDVATSFGPVVNKIFLKSPNGTIWVFGITDLNEVVLMTGTIDGGWFRVCDLQNKPLFSVHSQSQLGFSYLPVFNSTNLPSVPDPESTNIPWAFFENEDGDKRPIYHDGGDWRYFHSNEKVN